MLEIRSSLRERERSGAQESNNRHTGESLNVYSIGAFANHVFPLPASEFAKNAVSIAPASAGAATVPPSSRRCFAGVPSAESGLVSRGGTCRGGGGAL